MLYGRGDGGSAVTHVYQVPTGAFSIQGMDTGATVTIGATDGTSPSGIDLQGADLNADVSKSKTGLSNNPLAYAFRPGTIKISADIVTEAGNGADAGNVTIQAGKIVVEEGVQILADVPSGETGSPGKIKLEASNLVGQLNNSTSTLIFDDFAKLTAKVTIAGGVTIRGGDVSITSDAGDQSVESLAANMAGGFNFLGIADLPADIISLPVAVFYKRSSAEIEIGDGVNAVDISATGNVSLATDATSLARGDALFWYNNSLEAGARGQRHDRTGDRRHAHP